MRNRSGYKASWAGPGSLLGGSPRMGSARTVLGLALLAACLAFSGCSTDQHGDLDAYVKEVKARHKGRVPPLPEIKPYETFAYDAKDIHDPFQPFAPQAERKRQAQADSGIRPDKNRRREALEEFSLDSLKYVGQLEKAGQPLWALIEAPDHTVHRVKVGDHLGQNYGQITRITSNQIDLKEIIPNGLGGWTERQAALALKE